MQKILILVLTLYLDCVAPSPDICTICSCNNPVINCRDKGLTTTNYSWPDWKDSEIDLDFNFFVVLTKFPAVNASRLSLADNRLRVIEEKTFENLPTLVELNLSNNYLTDLHPEIFSGQFALGYFRPIKLLRILDLSHNEIVSLHPDLFVHLPNLEMVNLSNNPIKIIDDNTRVALSKIPFIKILDLSYTGVGYLPEYFLHNSYYLKILNLEGNNITSFPQEFRDDGHGFVNIKLENNPVYLGDKNVTGA